MEYNRIRVVLALKNKKNKDLCEALNVSNQTVSMWVNNHRQPTIKNLFRIAEVLDVDAGDLLVKRCGNDELQQIT